MTSDERIAQIEVAYEGGEIGVFGIIRQLVEREQELQKLREENERLTGTTYLELLVGDLQRHAKECGWQDVDEPIAALLAWQQRDGEAQVNGSHS